MGTGRMVGVVLGAALALAGCGGGRGEAGCTTAEACPGTDGACQQRTCLEGACGLAYAEAGAPLANQAAGDCLRATCDGAGGITSAADDADLPEDGDPCTGDVCLGGVASNPLLEVGTACGEGLLCDGAGACVGCLTASDCPGADTACRVRTCGAGACGLAEVADGTPCDDGDARTAGDVCAAGTCAGIDHCAGVTCTALDPCHEAGTCVDHATGACSTPARADGTPCDDGDARTAGDACTAGTCAGVDHCLGVACTPLDPCHEAGVCVDHATGACSTPAKADGAACDDGNPCTAETCSAGACAGTALPPGTACGSGLACDGLGACTPVPAVTATTPADGGSALASTTVSVAFDQAMNPASLVAQTAPGACQGSIQLSLDDFASCVGFAGAIPAMSGGNRVALLAPAPGLLVNRGGASSRYKVRVTTAAASALGLPLAAAYTSATGFATTNPISGAGAAQNESGVAGEVAYCALLGPSPVSGSGGSAVQLAGLAWDGRYAGSYASLVTQVGRGPRTSNPQYQGGWSWSPAAYTTMQGGSAEYTGTLTLPSAGTYATAFRVSLDGGATWTYCDRAVGDLGAGSNPGLTFDLERLGELTAQ